MIDNDYDFTPETQDERDARRLAEDMAWAEHEADLREWDDIMLEAADAEAAEALDQWNDYDA